VSLAFLSPGSSRTSASSPMERAARAAGAQIHSRDGWSVAADYGDPALERERIAAGVGFADRSSLAKFEVLAPAEQLAGILSRAGAPALGLGTAARTGTTWWCPVTPARALVLAEPADAAAMREALMQAAEGESATVVDITSGLAAMSLLGPGARELLARFCAIDVRPAVAPPASFRPGSIARTPGYLLIERDEALLALVGWALGAYLWDLVADAAAHLGGGPVGADALAHHLGSLDA